MKFNLFHKRDRQTERKKVTNVPLQIRTRTFAASSSVPSKSNSSSSPKILKIYYFRLDSFLLDRRFMFSGIVVVLRKYDLPLTVA